MRLFGIFSEIDRPKDLAVLAKHDQLQAMLKQT